MFMPTRQRLPYCQYCASHSPPVRPRLLPSLAFSVTACQACEKVAKKSTSRDVLYDTHGTLVLLLRSIWLLVVKPTPPAMKVGGCWRCPQQAVSSMRSKLEHDGRRYSRSTFSAAWNLSPMVIQRCGICMITRAVSLTFNQPSKQQPTGET